MSQQGNIIDLICAGEGFDGERIYMSPADATKLQALRGAVWLLVTYPRQVFGCLALVGLGALSLHMVTPEPKPAPRPRHRRRP
jgi:hypothetical protein